MTHNAGEETTIVEYRYDNDNHAQTVFQGGFWGIAEVHQHPTTANTYLSFLGFPAVLHLADVNDSIGSNEHVGLHTVSSCQHMLWCNRHSTTNASLAVNQDPDEVWNTVTGNILSALG